MALHRRRILISVILLAALVMVLVVVLSPAPKAVPLPNPNGYDDFVKAGGMVDRGVSDYPVLDREGLSELVASNHRAVALGRLGLSRKSRMPQWFSFPTNGTTSLVAIKLLAQAFAAEGRLAHLEGNNEQAVRCYLDAVRLGNESSRGGLMIHRLVGIACEHIGMENLKRIMTNLNCAEIRLAVTELTKVNDSTVPWSEISRAERRFMIGQYKQYRNPIRFVADFIEGRRSIAKVEAKNRGACLDLRILMTDLAIRCYLLEQGRPPESLDRLVPKYIPSVPTDPVNGTPLRYRLQGTNSSVETAALNRPQ